jgi:hypothetical protein
MTLADAVREIDALDPDSGVTESLLSAWELGKRRTSARYRKLCCAIYGLPPEVLFAHQDDPGERARFGLAEAGIADPYAGLATPAEVVARVGELLEAMLGSWRVRRSTSRWPGRGRGAGRTWRRSSGCWCSVSA